MTKMQTKVGQMMVSESMVKMRDVRMMMKEWMVCIDVRMIRRLRFRFCNDMDCFVDKLFLMGFWIDMGYWSMISCFQVEFLHGMNQSDGISCIHPNDHRNSSSSKVLHVHYYGLTEDEGTHEKGYCRLTYNLLSQVRK